MHWGQQEMLSLAAPTAIAQSRTEPAESPNFLAATKVTRSRLVFTDEVANGVYAGVMIVS